MSEMPIYHKKNFPATSTISHFDLISSSNSFAVMSSLIKSFFFAFPKIFSKILSSSVLSEMHERREKAYLTTFNEDLMLVEDCDTILPSSASTATAADAEVVASSLHEVRSDR